VDQRGALRMAAWLFVCLAASAFLQMHDSATTQELSVYRAGADPLVAVAAITIYGFRTSLAGRPLFSGFG